MNYTITTNLESEVYNFLTKWANSTKQTKKSVIEDALKMYQKQKLKEQVTK
jgi:predicted transcriptional regulator